MTETQADRVLCYSGHTYAQEPRAIVWQGDHYTVTAVERRWRTPEGPAFEVRAEAVPGAEEWFKLHYLEGQDRWTIQARPGGSPRSEAEPVGTPEPALHKHYERQGGPEVS